MESCVRNEQKLTHIMTLLDVRLLGLQLGCPYRVGRVCGLMQLVFRIYSIYVRPYLTTGCEDRQVCGRPRRAPRSAATPMSAAIARRHVRLKARHFPYNKWADVRTPHHRLLDDRPAMPPAPALGVPQPIHWPFSSARPRCNAQTSVEHTHFCPNCAQCRHPFALILPDVPAGGGPY